MTKSLGQQLWEAKEKTYLAKSKWAHSFYAVTAWNDLSQEVKKGWRKYALEEGGKDDMDYYVMQYGFYSNKTTLKKKIKKPIRYLNKTNV